MDWIWERVGNEDEPEMETDWGRGSNGDEDKFEEDHEIPIFRF